MTGPSGPTPRRVTVTGPHAHAVRRPAGRPGVRALDEQDVVGDLLIRSLVRTQLALALRVAALFAVLAGGLPLVFALAPASRTARLLGLPLPWLLLGVLVYPALLVAAWGYVRQAERNERDFVRLVDLS